MTIFSELILAVVIMYIAYRGFQIINYLNFKIHVLQKILLWKFQDDKKIWNDAIDYVLDNDYEYKSTIRMMKIFSKPNNFETVDDLKLNLDEALGRFGAKHKK